LKRINPFDLLVFAIIILFLILFVLITFRSPRDLGEPVLMSVRVDQNVEVISPEARAGETVFVNGVNVESKILRAEKTEEGLDLVILGLGKKVDSLWTFNGQRVLIGQKVELRGSFWVQGIIKNLEQK